jgi:hypothetical protein
VKYELKKESGTKETELFYDLDKVPQQQQCMDIFTGKSVTSPGFLQRVSKHPFIITVHCPVQIEYAALADSLYLDATGSICKPHEKDSKRLLLHAVVGTIKDSSTSGVPVLEFITNKNDTSEIRSQLDLWRSEVLKINPLWNLEKVTVDFCFAYLHSTSWVFNNESLINNINSCFDSSFNNKPLRSNKVRIQICVAHTMHTFGRNLTRKAIPGNVRSLALHGMGKLIEVKNLHEFKHTISQVISVFGCDKLPQSIVRELSQDLKHGTLQEPYSEIISQFHHTIKTDEEQEILFPAIDSDIQKEKSKYYQYFLTREQHILSSVAESNKKASPTQQVIHNSYFSREVLDVLVTYVPYYPLWSAYGGLFPRIHENNTSSNAPVERYIGIHKNNLHPELKEYPPRHVEEHGPIVVGLVNENFQLRQKTNQAKCHKK